MKELILINGTMGIGKTATSRELQKLLPQCVFLDGDWCWDSSPWIVTDETKAMVLKNIGFLLNSFLHCTDYKNIIFCWVMDEQAILDHVLGMLDGEEYRLHVFSLICTENALVERLLKDVDNGLRTKDIIGRSVARLKHYDGLNTIKLDVTDTTPRQAAKEIARRLGKSTC